MENNKYIAPELDVVVLETETLMIAASSGINVDTSGDFSQRGNGRRGDWAPFLTAITVPPSVPWEPPGSQPNPKVNFLAAAVSCR